MNRKSQVQKYPGRGLSVTLLPDTREKIYERNVVQSKKLGAITIRLIRLTSAVHYSPRASEQPRKTAMKSNAESFFSR